MWSSSPGFGLFKCPWLSADEVVKLALGRSGLSILRCVVVFGVNPEVRDMRVAVLRLLESSLFEVNLSENIDVYSFSFPRLRS